MRLVVGFVQFDLEIAVEQLGRFAAGKGGMVLINERQPKGIQEVRLVKRGGFWILLAVACFWD